MPQALGKGSKRLGEDLRTLGDVFAKCCTQARALREQGLGEQEDAEYQTMGTHRLLIFPSAGVTLNEQLLKK